jgi:parvulin-like peptidyl-prolyl isomerase
MNSVLRCFASLFLSLVAILSIAAEPQRNLAVGASAEKRIALVIGNSKYSSSPLKNPVNDAHDMAAALRKIGFDVIERTDVTQKEMNRAITQFGSKLTSDAMALFFYAGHGMQVKGKNYLIPIDAQIENEASVRSETVDVDAVLDQLSVSPLNIVILDACRNNPFERRFRSVGGGLAQMDAPKGTLIAYATSPGKVASDGTGRNGVYTQELLKVIQTPGLPVEQAFKRVRSNVAKATGDNQIPWEASSLTGDFSFKSGLGVHVANVGPSTLSVRLQSDSEIEQEFWNAIKNSSDARDFEGYLTKYPHGRFVVLATHKVKELSRVVQTSDDGTDVKDTFARVDGRPIPMAAFKALVAAQAEKGEKDTKEFRKSITEELVRREVLVAAAEKTGIGSRPDPSRVISVIDGQSYLAQAGVLIGAYLKKYVSTHPVTGDQIKKEYEDVAAKLGSKEYKARHILVEKEGDAKAIIAKLRGGKKFEDLAKDSKDPGSKDRGGDLGWATPASYVQPFSAAMVKLEKGKFTETPVKSDFGWHVILLEDTRLLKIPPLDEAEAQIKSQLGQRIVQKHIDDLRSRAKVEIVKNVLD